MKSLPLPVAVLGLIREGQRQQRLLFHLVGFGRTRGWAMRSPRGANSESAAIDDGW
jgi:hypothetical protein